MGISKVKLTPEVEQQIMASIRAGGFPHVAAAAWGVPEEVFDQWLEMGKGKRAKPLYKNFARKVEQAQAQARLKAEMAAFTDDARFWLKNGPGRDQPNNPGWAAMMKPLLQEGNKTINLFGSADFLGFMATLRAALAPFPEALAALTEALSQAPLAGLRRRFHAK